MMDYQDWNGGVGQWFVMALLMLLFWGVAIALVMWAVRGSRSSQGQPGVRTGTPTDRPEDVLARRFASGEIDEDEFTRRREVLRSGTTR